MVWKQPCLVCEEIVISPFLCRDKAVFAVLNVHIQKDLPPTMMEGLDKMDSGSYGMGISNVFITWFPSLSMKNQRSAR